MQTILPSELTPALPDAIPIMHRLLLRMDSFPYQNNPMKFLTLEILRTACTFINNNIYTLYRSPDFQAILFQSLAGFDSACLPGNNQEYTKPGNEDDDKHLEHAVWNTRRQGRDPDNPRIMIRGPENPPLSHFPSSWPRKLDQAIPTGDLRSFLRLMLFLNLGFTGFDVSGIAECSHQTEVVTDYMLAVFRPGLAGISWDNFVDALADMLTNIASGLLPIFRAIVME